MKCTFSLRCANGFSYVEVLVASFLLAVTLVPALEALQPGIQGTSVYKIYIEDRYQLIAKMEALLAEPFTALQIAATAAGGPGSTTTYTDIITLANGRQLTREVYLSAYDGDNADADNDPFTGADPDLLWIKVVIEGTSHALENLSTR